MSVVKPAVVLLVGFLWSVFRSSLSTLPCFIIVFVIHVCCTMIIHRRGETTSVTFYCFTAHKAPSQKKPSVHENTPMYF